MAVLVKTSLSAGGAVTPTVNTLGASDTVTFNLSKQPIVYIDNVTVGELTINFDGADSTAFNVEGYGSVDPTAGFDVVVAAGAQAAFKVLSRREYLEGEVTITGGDGAEVVILEL